MDVCFVLRACYSFSFHLLGLLLLTATHLLFSWSSAAAHANYSPSFACPVNYSSLSWLLTASLI
jgi:hypothetical protein